MSGIDSAGASACVVGVEGRHVFLYVDDGKDAEERFAFALNGEPVRAVRVACAKLDFTRGMNLIENGDCREPELPWRIAGGRQAKLGRNFSEKWNLASGTTAYLMAAPEDIPVELEYAGRNGCAFVPVAAGATYGFEGYFGTHRCRASVRINLRSADNAPVAAFEWLIPKKLGGPALDGYGKVDMSFVAPPNSAKADIHLCIDTHVPAAGVSSGEAVLFFTHVSFGVAGANGHSWRPNCLTSEQVSALARDAAILDITLPRLPSAPSISPMQFEAFDRRTGQRPHGSPVLLRAAPQLNFLATSFDGVTLAGDMTGLTGRERLELAVDGEIAARLVPPPTAEPGATAIKFRIDDAFLDGAPHVLELGDAASGKTLFLNAAILKSFVTPWDVLEEFGRSPWPLELHPMARRRYQNLAAHMTAFAEAPKCAATAQRVGQCFALLSGLPAPAVYETELKVPAPRKPAVSVILCADDLRAAYRSAAAVVLAYNRISFDVIVGFAGTEENAARLGELVSGATIVRTEPDKGFAWLANRAVASARAPFVALLAAPAEPGAYWLDELRLVFDLFDSVGMAGAKLLQPNGRLHEAGGIVWTSGHCQPIGRNANPEHPQVNYARQADYVSSAAFMIRRSTWDAIGGVSEDLFDPVLEAADLAFKARSKDLKIIYAPHAVVTVEKGGLSDQPHSPGGQASIAIFKRNWADRLLAGRPENSSVQQVIDAGINGRVLFIDQQLPRGDIDGGSYAAIQETRLFQALGYRVTFLPVNLTHLGVYTRALQRIGVEVLHAPFAASVEEAIKARGPEFDLVYVTRHHVGRTIIPLVRKHAPRAKIIFNNADLHFLRELRAALAAKDAELLRRSRLTRDQELEVMRQADLTLSYSEVEHAVIQSHNFDQTRVAKAPWVVTAAESIAPYSERRDIAFVGSFGHRPNVEAAVFFVSDVMPHLRRRLPEARFVIHGSQIGREIDALKARDVIVAGHVDDLAGMFAAARVFVAPLLSGAGLKAKVLCAMGYGVPSVLSPAAAEGIGGKAGREYLVAQSPDEWADAIDTLYGDEVKWTQTSQRGLEFVRANYSFENGLETLRRALESIDVVVPRNPDSLWSRAPLPPLL